MYVKDISQNYSSLSCQNALFKSVKFNKNWEKVDKSFCTTCFLVPATTCTPERTFSVLSSLKTYLRSTMTQARLNHLAEIHSNKDIADSLDLDKLIGRMEKREFPTAE